MSDTEKRAQDPAEVKSDECDYTVDESICSAEFPAGCTLTVDEQSE